MPTQNPASATAANPSPQQAYAAYNSPAPIVPNGAVTPVQTDSHANLAVTLGTALAGEDLTNNVMGEARKHIVGPTYSRTDFGAIAAVSGVAKASAGQLCSYYAANGATACYFQIFQSATVPATGNPAYRSYPMAANGFIVFDDTFTGPNGRYSAAGWSWGFSSTASTYTALGSATGLSVDGTVV